MKKYDYQNLINDYCLSNFFQFKDLPKGDYCYRNYKKYTTIENAIKDCIYEAYSHFLLAVEADNIQSFTEKDCMIKLTPIFQKYLKEDVNDYNLWHKCVCKTLIKNIDSINILDGQKKIKFTYGCAQFIVNLIFKNLFCILNTGSNSIKYMQYFKNSHFILDNYTLEFVKYICDDSLVSSIKNNFWEINEKNYFLCQKIVKKHFGVNSCVFLEEFNIDY